MLNLGSADEDKVANLKAQLNEKLDVYEKILSKQPYLGDQVNRLILLLKEKRFSFDFL